MTDEDAKYLAEIDRIAVERGYMPVGDSLVAATGPECWLDAWHDDPTLTAEDQVIEEIICAMSGV